MLAFASQPAHSQQKLSGLIINADDSEYDMENKRASLTGKVQLVWNGNYLSAAKADVDLANKVIVAEGDVVIQNSKLHAEASRVEYNYDTERGYFYNSFVQSGQVVFEGKIIEKTGEDTFIASKAEYTACKTCPAAWSFSGKQIEAEMGGYAWISRPILRIGGFPVLILPGLIVPLKSKRQSGFLVPQYNTSARGGNTLGMSYFWAISRNKDLTITGRNFEKRGFQTDLEYRYVLNSKSRGKLNFAHIRDRQFPNERKVDKEIDRWYLDYAHVYEMPDNLTHRVKLTNVSDLRYPIDFPRQLGNNTDPSLENTMSLTKTTDTQFASIEGTYNINLLKEDPLASNTDSVHRLPEINYNVTNQRIFNTGILAKLDVNYVNFTRSGLSYDDIEADGSDFRRKEGRDGSFNPNPGDGSARQWDLIRTGHRFDAAPTFSAPFQLGQFVDVLPQVTYRETHYQFQIDDDVQSLENYAPSANRRYVQTDLAARMQFSRVYGDLLNEKGARLKHEIEPQVSVSTIPWIKRPEHGFFGDFTDQAFSQSLEPITDEDVFGENRLQFDYNDRVFDRSLFTYSLTNKLTRKTWKYGQPVYTNVLLARITQSYDINEANDREKPEPWLPVNALIKMKFANFETFTQAQYYPYAKQVNWSSRTRVQNSSGDYLQVIYSKFIRVREDNSVISDTQTENIRPGVGLTTKYLNLFGEVSYSNVTFEVLQWRYSTIFKPPGNCIQLMFSSVFTPNGDAMYYVDANFNFGGDI